MSVASDVLADRYQLGGRIAVGGVGEVWRGTDTLLGRPVAIKLLRAEYAQHAETLSRFRSEARHAGALSHRNIAQVYDYGDADPPMPPYLVMELVDGPSLAGLLARGPLDATQTMDVIAQAAEGLAAAHAADLVHRDIKPANLMIGPGGQVKITDFGIAHAADAAPLTRTGMLVGTPAYLAPERVSGERATPASDLYALGIVAYECLTGGLPFTGSPLEVASAQRSRSLPPLPWHVPPAVSALVAELTAKNPARRPAGAGAVASRAAALRGAATVSMPGLPDASGPGQAAEPGRAAASRPAPATADPLREATADPQREATADPQREATADPQRETRAGPLAEPWVDTLRDTGADVLPAGAAGAPGPVLPDAAPGATIAGTTPAVGGSTVGLGSAAVGGSTVGPEGTGTQPGYRRLRWVGPPRLGLAAVAAAVVAAALAGFVLALLLTGRSAGSQAGSPAAAGKPGAGGHHQVAAGTVWVNARQYVGLPVVQARAKLRRMGLTVHVLLPPGDPQAARTVLAVQPSGRVPVGSGVTIIAASWRETQGHGHGHGSGGGNQGGNGGGEGD